MNKARRIKRTKRTRGTKRTRRSSRTRKKKRMIQRGGAISIVAAPSQWIRAWPRLVVEPDEFYYKNSFEVGEWEKRNPETQIPMAGPDPRMDQRPKDIREIKDILGTGGIRAYNKICDDIRRHIEVVNDATNGPPPSDHNYADPRHPNWGHVWREGGKLYAYKNRIKQGPVLIGEMVLRDI